MFLVVPLIILLFGNEDIAHKQSFCPFKMLTGFPCPGCGITKSIIAVYQGNLMESFNYHIFGLFVVIVCAFLIPLLIYEIISGKEYFNNLFYSRKIAVCLAVILILYHFIRLVVFIKTHSWSEIVVESIWK
jgi:hydrogenase-4 membrane subunit HyfE